MAKKTEISAAEALKTFKGKAIEVQEARAVTLKGEDGKERPGFKTEMKPISEKHVLAAASYDDGRVTIVTIDGRRHEARAA